jgi:hypothetical protein
LGIEEIKCGFVLGRKLAFFSRDFVETRMQVVNLLRVHVTCVSELFLQLCNRRVITLNNTLKFHFYGLKTIIHIVDFRVFFLNQIFKLSDIFLQIEVNFLKVFIHLLGINLVQTNESIFEVVQLEL